MHRCVVSAEYFVLIVLPITVTYNKDDDDDDDDDEGWKVREFYH